MMMKMNKMKKGIAFLMVLLMSGSLVSCGPKQSTTNTSGNSGDTSTAEGTDPLIFPEDTVTLTCYSQTANYSGELTGWFAHVLLEKFNVKVNIIPDTDGVYDTRMESGDLGDIIVFGGDVMTISTQ